MAGHSQGTTVTFNGGQLSEVISVSANKTSDAAAAANDGRIDVSHLGLAVGSDRLYLSAPLVDVAAGGGTDGLGGDVSVEMYGSPPAAGAVGALSVGGGGMSVSFDCVAVTSSGISLAVGEAAKASVTFTVKALDDDGNCT